MFSIATSCCSVYHDVDDHKVTERLKVALISDLVLNLIFAIISVLGFSGVLPLAVGITFLVFAIIQLAINTCIKVLLQERSASHL